MCESCHTHVWVMSHSCMSHVTYMYAWKRPRLTLQALQHTATHSNALQHTATHCNNTLQHTRTVHAPDIAGAQTHTRVWHDSFTCVTWLIHTCDLTHSHMWYDSFTRVTRLIKACRHASRDSLEQARVPRNGRYKTNLHDSYMCVTWLIHVWDVTHICPDGVVYMHTPQSDMTHSHVRHDSYMCVTWLITHTCVWHDSYMWVTRLKHVCVTWLTHAQMELCTLKRPSLTSLSLSFIVTNQYNLCHEPIQLMELCTLKRPSLTSLSLSFIVTNQYNLCHEPIQLMKLCTLKRPSLTCLIHMCDVTHSWVWHDSPLIHVCNVTHTSRGGVYVCDMTHSRVWHDSHMLS